MSQTVVGIFNNADDARHAVSKLLDNGFNESNVDYARGPESEEYLQDANYHDETRTEHESGIGRFFRNLFGDDDESDRYARVAKRGCIVTVHAESTEEARRATELLDECGAVDVDEKDREYGETAREYNAEKDREYVAERDREYNAEKDRMVNREQNGEYTARKDREFTGEHPNVADEKYFDTARNESKKIPVVEETLNVGKKVVEKGGVRVHSRIVEKPVEKTIRLREEHVYVERNKVDKPVTDADLNEFKEGTIDVREHAEVPVVTKDTNVVEEVSVNKTVGEREETIRDNVRRKEVDVEDVDTGRKKTNL